METAYADTLTYEEVCWGEDLDGWEQVDHQMGDTWRWGHWEHYVYKRLSDNTYWMFDIQRTSGDQGDGWDSDHIPPNQRVYPKEVTTIEWLNKEPSCG